MWLADSRRNFEHGLESDFLGGKWINSMNWKNLFWGIMGSVSGVYIMRAGDHPLSSLGIDHPFIYWATTVIAVILFCIAAVVLYGPTLTKYH
jgi:hypothetical protein